MNRIALAGVLALVSWSASAYDAPGWRVNAAASFTEFKGNDSVTPSLGNDFIDDNAVGFKVSAQYQFDKWLAVEGSYHTSGNLKSQSTSQDFPGNLEIDFKGFSGHVLVYLPLQTDALQAYVKGGYFDFDDDLSLNGVTTSTSSESGFAAGGGFVIKMTDQFGIRADGDWFDADVGDLWSVNIGLQYVFGHRTEPTAERVAAPEDDAAE